MILEKTFSKRYRLLKKKDFENLRFQSVKVHQPLLSAYFKNSSPRLGETRVAFSVSRKVGKAWLRNRVKRLLKERFRSSCYKNLEVDILFVVYPRQEKELSVWEKKLIENFLTILEKIKNDAK